MSLASLAFHNIVLPYSRSNIHIYTVLYVSDSTSSKGPARNFGKKKKTTGDFEKKPRNSLRLDTGKKGRSAEKNMSRGSLKKRDRSAEKERKREAAIERSTVVLPEYVILQNSCLSCYDIVCNAVFSHTCLIIP